MSSIAGNGPLDWASVLFRRGEFAAAAAYIETLPPGLRLTAEALTLQGIAQYADGQVDAGIKSLERAVAKAPRHVPALLNLGTALLETSKATEAVLVLQRGVEVAPSNIDLRLRLADAEIRCASLERARVQIEYAIEIAPERFDARQALVDLRLRLGDRAGAEAMATQTLSEYPEQPAAHRLAIGFLIKLQRHREALGLLAVACERWPADASWLISVQSCLRALRRWPESLAVAEQLVAARPDWAEAWSNMCNLLRDLGRLEASIECGNRAVTLAPNDATMRFGLAYSLLRAGRYTEGWLNYESRWQGTTRLAGFSWPQFDGNLWSGEPLAGKTLFVWHEQGFGDSIQAARYLPLLAAGGARVIYRVPTQLHRLFSSLKGIEVIDIKEALPPHDFHCPNMTLPRLFATTLDSIPPTRLDFGVLSNPIPELAIPADRPRIGIVWQVTAGPNDPRGLDDAALAHLVSRLSNCQLYSMQMGDLGSGGPRSHLIDVSGKISDFADTAAIMRCMDAVIAVDTAALHLAGALGRPSFGLLPFNSEWRWGRTGEGSAPWYPDMRLFKQTVNLDWGPAIEAMASVIAERKFEGPYSM